jgi:hypothetical protein
LGRLWIQFVLLLGTLSALPAGAATQSVTLAWDPSPDTNVAGYYVYFGTASRGYTGRVDSQDATRATVSGLVPGQTYYFAVTAYNSQRLESVPSGEIVYTVPSPVLSPARLLPGNGSLGPRLEFQIKPTRVYEVQGSEDLQSWRTIERGVSLSTNWLEYVDPQAGLFPQRFYRLVVPDRPPVPGWMRLLSGATPGGTVCLRPNVAVGQRYRIEASEDLRVWTPLHEGVCVAGQALDVVDAQAGRYAQRFYRLALLGSPTASGALQIYAGNGRGGSRLQLAALAGQGYRIEASVDLQTWETIGGGTALSTDPVELVDPQAGQYASRFYRLAFD